MKKHIQYLPILEQGCRALSNLTCGNLETKMLIASPSTIHVILAAMRLHTEEAPVQHYGLSILRNLSSNAKNKDLVASVGGISIIIVGMRHYSDHAGIQEQACASLYNLAQSNFVALCLLFL
jgi:hypothetical protein